MRGERSSRLYRSLTRLYPSSFRAAYGDDLVAVFEQQLRAGRPAAVWSRTVRDLAVSVPVEHVVVLAHRSPYDIVAVSAAAVATTGIVVAFVTSRLVPSVFGATVAIAASALAWSSWHAGRPLRSPGSVSSAWWLCLVLGVACVAFGMAIAAGTDQEFGRLYWVWLVVSLTGLVLLAFGALLGAIHAVGVRRRRHVDAVR